MRFALLSVILFAAGFAGFAAAACGQVPAAASRPELDLLTRPQIAVVAVELGEHWRGPEGANLATISAAHPVILSSDLTDFQKQSEVSPQQIERALLLFGEGPPTLVVTFSDAATLAKYRRYQFAEAIEESAGDRKLLVGGKGGMVGYELTDRTMVVGGPPAIESFLKQAAPPAEPGEAVRSFQTLARGKPLLALQIDVDRLRDKLQAPAAAYGLAPLVTARAWRLVLKTTTTGLQITLSAEFPDEASAAGSVEALKTVQSQVGTYFTAAATEMPAMLAGQGDQYPGAPKIAPFFASALQRISAGFSGAAPQAAGRTLSLDFHVATDTPVADAVFLATLLPRAAKEKS